ncbi:hypothetical protein [Microvirga lenta]|uniref:hypothetical protein n=1 Tax=Microvirga lenta TaxID=2881337 RepID=UPI001D000DE6|nr:hypothetical protein [Microvirga lenta]MCB5177500.1 hypothetical protein [Microvirga lenta]
MRADRAGWTVYDVATGRPVILGDVALIGISFEDADSLVNLLNVQDRESARGASRSSPAPHPVSVR